MFAFATLQLVLTVLGVFEAYKEKITKEHHQKVSRKRSRAIQEDKDQAREHLEKCRKRLKRGNFGKDCMEGIFNS